MATAQLSTLLRHIHKLAAGRGALQRTDRQLLDDFSARRDENAFAALVARHGPMVLRVCRRVLNHEQDAEDAFQATFLILARKTGSIRKREALAEWLHGVAYRAAMEVKRSAARRRGHEARLWTLMRKAAVSPTWDDVQAVLDEEIQRLPEAYRAAFVLCLLEGKSGPQAAAELKIKEGTVWSRLTRARRLLQRRLTRRGLKLAAVLAALSVADSAGKAAVPALLASATVRCGLLVAAGGPAAGQIPSHIAALAAGVTRAMLLTKAKIAMAVMLAVGLFAAAGVLGRQALAAKGTERPAADQKAGSPTPKKKSTLQAADEPAGAVQFKGRVVDPEGKPITGALVYLVDQSSPLKARTTSAYDGRFHFEVARADLKLNSEFIDPWQVVFMVAKAPGYGPAVGKAPKPGQAETLTLRLVKDDVPIQGRVLDLEGRPIAAASVRVDSLIVPNEGDLTAFLEELKVSNVGLPTELKFLTWVNQPGLGSLFAVLKTDAEGRFQLKGIGRERLAGLTISGPTIETRQVRVRTRPGETMQRIEWREYPGAELVTYYGATFDHSARPTRPVTGVVRDKDTGKPLEGALVSSGGRDLSRTTTDKEGRYRLVGMPKSEGNSIKASPPDSQPYLEVVKPVANTPGLETATVDFELKRGIWIKGRVADKITGEPIVAYVEYFVFRDNPQFKEYPQAAWHDRPLTKADGSFQFVGMPGRSLVATRAQADRYLVGTGAERYKQHEDRYGLLLETSPACRRNNYHALVEVETTKDADTAECKLVLDPGRTMTGSVVGPDGKPLAGALMSGRSNFAGWEQEPLKTAEFTAYAFGGGRPRNLLFLHEEKKLAGSLLVRGDEKGPLTVKLQPWATVSGRLLTAGGGLPRTSGELWFLARSPDDAVGSHPRDRLPIGKDGKFRIEGLIPGLKYNLGVMDKGDLVGYVFQDFAMKSGETKDLGDVEIKRNE